MSCPEGSIVLDYRCGALERDNRQCTLNHLCPESGRCCEADPIPTAVLGIGAGLCLLGCVVIMGFFVYRVCCDTMASADSDKAHRRDKANHRSRRESRVSDTTATVPVMPFPSPNAVVVIGAAHPDVPPRSDEGLAWWSAPIRIQIDAPDPTLPHPSDALSPSSSFRTGERTDHGMGPEQQGDGQPQEDDGDRTSGRVGVSVDSPTTDDGIGIASEDYAAPVSFVGSAATSGGRGIPHSAVRHVRIAPPPLRGATVPSDDGDGGVTSPVPAALPPGTVVGYPVFHDGVGYAARSFVGPPR